MMTAGRIKLGGPLALRNFVDQVVEYETVVKRLIKLGRLFWESFDERGGARGHFLV